MDGRLPMVNNSLSSYEESDTMFYYMVLITNAIWPLIAWLLMKLLLLKLTIPLSDTYATPPDVAKLFATTQFENAMVPS